MLFFLNSERIPTFSHLPRLGKSRLGVTAAIATEAKELSRSVRSIIEMDGKFNLVLRFLCVVGMGGHAFTHIIKNIPFISALLIWAA